MTFETSNLIGAEQLKALTTKVGELMVTFGMDVLGALTILVIGWWFARWAQKSVKRVLGKTKKVDATLKPLIASVVRYTILIFVIVAVLSQFGVETTSIIAVLGAAGLAVGLALQGTLSNIAAGVMILLLRPLRVNEFIDAGGIAGTVMEIGLFTTIMKTGDGIYLSVPNSEIWGKAIANYSRNKTRRLDLAFGISYEDSIDQATKILTKFFKDKRILKDPEPQVMVTTLGDNAVTLNMRMWCAREDYWDLNFELTKGVKQAFDKAGVSMPFPQRDVYVYDMGKKKG